MTDPLAVDDGFAALADAVFERYRASHPPTETVTLNRGLWAELDALGLVRLTSPETSGGSGAGWAEASALIAAAVRHGVRLPLAEHDLLADWLLREVGLDGVPRIRTVASLDRHGRARFVPWARAVDSVVLVWPAVAGYRAADVPVERLRIVPGANLIGEPRDTIVLDSAPLGGVVVPDPLAMQLKLKSAMVRAMQITAALNRTLEITVEHAKTRVQFGKPLSRLQAVQRHISDIAGESAVAQAATESALMTAIASDWTDPTLEFLVAVARSCAGHASSVVVRSSHQVHGAIGTTKEHRLHEFTRAALAWRSEYGSLRSWDELLTEAALAAGADGLWTLITGGFRSVGSVGPALDAPGWPASGNGIVVGTTRVGGGN